MGSSRGAQFSLISAILFALVAIGFSAFILFWKAPQQTPVVQQPKILTQDQKDAVMQQLNQAPQSPTVQAPPSKPPTAQEADPNDTNAAAKLQILHSLNAK